MDLKTSNGSTALHNAANCGHSAVVKQLLQAGAGVGQCALTGANALFNAATAGHTECVEVLLEAGSIVDAVTTSGSTALHSAASNGHAEVVQRLIAAGADVDVQVCHVAFDINTMLLLLLLLLLLLCIYSTDSLHVHISHVCQASRLYLTNRISSPVSPHLQTLHLTCYTSCPQMCFALQFCQTPTCLASGVI